MNRNIFISICISVLVLSFTACKEDPGLIGLGVQPSDEYLNTDYFDTTTIIAYSTLHDSIVSSNVSINMLGYLDDAVFGKTQANIYTQFRLPTFKKDFGINAIVDSLVLTLAYSGYYGDTLNSLQLGVYELTEDLTLGTKYYTNSSLNHDASSLTESGNFSFQPRPKTKPDTSATTGVLRIRLKSDFARDKFISQSGSPVYASQGSFLNHFKGLLIKAEGMSGNGCMLSMGMTHSLSGLTIYYSNSEGSGQKYMLKMSDSTLHFGATKHDYSTAAHSLSEQLSGNQTSAQEILYGQAGAGTKVVFNFPNIYNMFKDKKTIIHRAALVINCMEESSPVLLPPSALAITSTDSVKLSGILPDYYLGLINGKYDYYGGGYNSSKKEYRFHITQYIQFLVDGTLDNYPLNLLLSPNITYFSRLQMYGTNPGTNHDKRIRLEVNYTIIE